MFISFLYVFRGTTCLSSTLHTRQSSTQSVKYQVSHRYSYVSWWWAHSCSKRREKK